MTTNYGLHRHSRPKSSALILLPQAAAICSHAYGFALPVSLADDILRKLAALDRDKGEIARP